jgi:hypothetical protein
VVNGRLGRSEMTLDKLIDEVGLIELTDADIEEMQARINEADEIFAAEAEAKRITIEWLNYEYTV